MKTKHGLIELETGAGLPEAFVLRMLRRMKTIGEVSPRLFTEHDKRVTLPTFTCGHCSSTVVLGPSASSERPYCRACNTSLCRECGAQLLASQRCRNRIQEIERAQERAALGKQHETPALVIVSR